MADPPTKIILDMQLSGLNDDEIIRRLREQGYAEKDINDAFNLAKVKSTIRADEYAPAAPAPPASPVQAGPPTPTTAEMPAPAAVPAPAPPTESGEFVPTPAPAQEGYEQSDPTQEAEYGYEYPQSQQTAGYGEAAYTAETFEEIAESIIEEKWRTFTEKVGDLQGWKEGIDREIGRIEKRIEKIDDTMIGIHSALLEKVGEYGKSIKGLGSNVKAVEKALSHIIEPLMKNVKELKEVTESLKKRDAKKAKR